MSQRPVPGTWTKVGQARRLCVRVPRRRDACPTLALERAAPGSPIWPCTRWGFPCLRAYAWSGGLLPHLFTLIPQRGTVCFLWHCPSACLTAAPPAYTPQSTVRNRRRRLRGIAPSGVRTFLPPESSRGSDPPPFQNHHENTPEWEINKPQAELAREDRMRLYSATARSISGV